jgi:hypothetical protein
MESVGERTSNNILSLGDLTVIRSLCNDHSAACRDCGMCVYCTVPHRCCCGKCGPSCIHDHEPCNSVCFQMQELNHHYGC